MHVFHDQNKMDVNLGKDIKSELIVTLAASSICESVNILLTSISSRTKQSDSDILCGQKNRTILSVFGPMSCAIENNKYLQTTSDFDVRTLMFFFIKLPLNNCFDMFSFYLVGIT